MVEVVVDGFEIVEVEVEYGYCVIGDCNLVEFFVYFFVE